LQNVDALSITKAALFYFYLKIATSKLQVTKMALKQLSKHAYQTEE